MATEQLSSTATITCDNPFILLLVTLFKRSLLNDWNSADDPRTQRDLAYTVYIRIRISAGRANYRRRETTNRRVRKCSGIDTLLNGNHVVEAGLQLNRKTNKHTHTHTHAHTSTHNKSLNYNTHTH